MDHLDRWRCGASFLQELGQFPFGLGARDQMNPGNLSDLFRLQLGITTHDHNLGLRGMFQRLPNYPGAFAIGLVGHRTGIDDVNISPLFEIYRSIATVFEGFADAQAIGIIQLASQGVHGHFGLALPGIQGLQIPCDLRYGIRIHGNSSTPWVLLRCSSRAGECR